MWKFLSRTFERGFRVECPTDVKNEVKRNINGLYTTYCCKKFTPCFLRALAKCKSNNDGPNENKHHSTTHDAERKILGAVSCSGALALGWALTQPYHWRKWWGRRDEVKFNKPNLVSLLATVANSQPINVGIHTDASLSVNRSNNEDAVDGDVPYGPKTAEEVLNEAVEEFREVHESVVASAENSRGVDFISANRHREAIALFRSASRRGCAPAAYNLAKCYEVGIGTEQDYSLAAKWYKVAADKGHATAKYNLGVFYAHGLGGLEASNAKARRLFEEAAEKGQPDAKVALDSRGHKKTAADIQNFVEGKDWGISQEDIESDITLAKLILQLHKNSSEKGQIEESSFELPGDITPTQLILQLHKNSSEKGQIEESSFAAGLLQEFLCHKKGREGVLSRLATPVML